MRLKLYLDEIYFTYYTAIRDQHRTDKEAFDEVESKCIELYGVNIFQSYTAFRIAKHRFTSSPTLYPITNCNLLTNIGYFNRFYELTKAACTQQQAWQTIEHEIKSIYDINVYPTFHSFERALQRYVKNIKQKELKSLLKLKKYSF